MLAQMPEQGNPQQAQDWPQPHRLQPCPYCHAPVYVFEEVIDLGAPILQKTGRWAAVDYGQTSDGNVIVNITQGTYQIVSRLDRAIFTGWRHALHSNICSRVDEWFRGR